ncbi:MULTISPECIES: pentapeptide repeat-containing protein [Bacillus amyloliquefaciens group]|uniref:pentapeptide repeat-containing protein n=1 Tax=Bacillus amyloliquefaciens group TaxID=1938374 RepID=UPI001780F50C|nr:MULTISPECIES: pentapeptide repeat-containing protein [Bacillus amyloliquefaciens group]QOH65781.1 pentapeptide repeat-containing protein [Bacillus amyloliquefaciens]WHY39637.1 pentapeptide repeat-containing protein [Bacillus velezensis]
MNTIQKPKIPKELPVLSFTEALQDDLIKEVVIENAVVNSKLDGLRAEKVIFRNTVFTDVSFRHMECTDVLFDKCDVSNADFSRSIIHRTAFQHSKLLGLNLADSAMRHVRFEDCLANYSSFSYSNMKHVRFDTCALTESEWNDAVLEYTDLDVCDLNGANFIGTSLFNMDISTCTFDHLHVSLEKLKGCRISPSHAITFAEALGAIVT